MKLQADSIHFIQYLNGSNKIYKYIEENEYGSIVIVNDNLNISNDTKLSFMIDKSDNYEDNYKYLHG